MHLRSRVRAALGVAALSLVAACGGVGGSGEDGLVVYSGRNENLVGELFEQFTAETGVEVTVRYAGSAELAAQLLEEGERTPAAVFLSQDAGALGALGQADRLEPLAQTVLDLVPEKYRSAEGEWVGVSGRARTLVYDPAKVDPADLPSSVFEMTDPQYRGQVGIAPPNASFQSFVTGMRVVAGEERTEEFLTGLKDNDVQTFPNNIAIIDAVNDGTISYGLVNHYYLYEKAAEAGGLDQYRPRNHFFDAGDPGSLVNVSGVAVLRGQADERTAALVDFLLGETGQRYFAEVTFEYPLVDGFALETGPVSEGGVPPLAEISGPDVDLSDLSSLAETLALLDKVGLT